MGEDCGCGCVLIVVDRQIVVEGWVRLGRTEGGGSGRKREREGGLKPRGRWASRARRAALSEGKAE